MSIWKYFKRISSEPVKRDEGLPEPTGPLSKSVPVKAIELANAEVKKVQARDSGGLASGGKRGPYQILTPAQRYEIGKRAAEHNTTVSLRYYAEKYPKLKLTEPSVRRFKNLYKELSGNPDQQWASNYLFLCVVFNYNNSGY